MKVGQEIHVGNYVAVLPHAHTSFHVVVSNGKNILLEGNAHKDVVVLNQHLIPVACKTETPGRYKYKTVCTITDSSNQKVVKKSVDSIYIEVVQ